MFRYDLISDNNIVVGRLDDNFEWIATVNATLVYVDIYKNDVFHERVSFSDNRHLVMGIGDKCNISFDTKHMLKRIREAFIELQQTTSPCTWLHTYEDSLFVLERIANESKT